jgi:hypothetical protein
MEATVKYNGVTQTTEGYEATLYMSGEKIRIGTFNSDVEAAVAYDATLVATLGDFAVSLNFPDLTEDELVSALDFMAEIV